MSVFDDKKQTAINIFKRNQPWIKWVHDSSQKLQVMPKTIINVVANLFRECCDTCKVLDSCWFAKYIMPQQPLHPNCHCKIEAIQSPIASITSIAEFDVRKFSAYAFAPEYKEKGKYDLLTEWGYSIIDSEFLANEFKRQVIEAYCNATYELHKLNQYGQQINIVVKLLNKTKNEIRRFYSGWMVEKNGKIRCVTPFGDWYE